MSYCNEVEKIIEECTGEIDWKVTQDLSGVVSGKNHTNLCLDLVLKDHISKLNDGIDLSSTVEKIILLIENVPEESDSAEDVAKRISGLLWLDSGLSDKIEIFDKTDPESNTFSVRINHSVFVNGREMLYPSVYFINGIPVSFEC